MTGLASIAFSIIGACSGPLNDLYAEAPGRVWAAAPVCADVVLKGMRAGVPLGLLTRLAFRESRFRSDRCSAKGACGPLQAIPRLWCPRIHPGWVSGRPCDLASSGVEALRYYLVKARGDERLALCWYTGRRGCQ